MPKKAKNLRKKKIVRTFQVLPLKIIKNLKFQRELLSTKMITNGLTKKIMLFTKILNAIEKKNTKMNMKNLKAMP